MLPLDIKKGTKTESCNTPMQKIKGNQIYINCLDKNNRRQKPQTDSSRIVSYEQNTLTFPYINKATNSPVCCQSGKINIKKQWL